MSRENKLVYCGTFMDHGGYAYMNRKMVRGLIDKGWNTRIEVIQGTQEIDQEEVTFFNSLRQYDDGGRPIPVMEDDVIKVVAHLPLINIPKFKHNIIYTMMESKGVNCNFVKNCNSFYKSCWTPTQYNADVFKEKGIEIPIKVVPIGIDDIYCSENAGYQWTYNYKVYGGENASKTPQGFKFLSVFRWSFRKGFDLLIKSFLREFSESDDVSLIIHSRHAAMSHDRRFYEYVENDLGRIYNENKKDNSPPIYLCSDIIPMMMMPSYYADHDCFISCSRGEGFCVPALEAAKMELPTILPYHTGFTDYVNDENSYKIDVDEWVVCNHEAEWRRGGWITGDFNGQEFPKFGDKAIEQTSFLMRRVVESPQEAQKKASKLKELVDIKYNWKNIVNSADDILSEIE